MRVGGFRKYERTKQKKKNGNMKNKKMVKMKRLNSSHLHGVMTSSSRVTLQGSSGAALGKQRLYVSCTLQWHAATCKQTKQTPWPQSASELYRPSDRRLSTKLMPTFCR
jgi:hypothetical protein